MVGGLKEGMEMLNVMLEWLAPVIGCVSGLNIAYLMWAACGLLFGALIGRVILLRIEAKDLGLELAWWQDRYRSLNLAREEESGQAFKDQQELRINLAKSQDSLSEACDKFNEYMAQKDARIRRLQGDLEMANRELSCAKAAIKVSGKIYSSHINLLDYLDKHCNISVRDEKGRFSGRVTANGLYDARFRQETCKGDI